MQRFRGVGNCAGIGAVESAVCNWLLGSIGYATRVGNASSDEFATNNRMMFDVPAVANQPLFSIRINAIAVALALCVLAQLAGAPSADACTCMSSGPACQAFWTTDVVFDGTVTALEPTSREETFSNRTFQVTESGRHAPGSTSVEGCRGRDCPGHHERLRRELWVRLQDGWSIPRVCESRRQ